MDLFAKAELTEYNMDYKWSQQTSYYQPYYPITQNVHIQQPMDWMELARPSSFQRAPDPVKQNHQDRFYPQNF